jgi:hypothetical protein
MVASVEIESIVDPVLRNMAIQSLVSRGAMSQEQADRYAIRLAHLHDPAAWIEHYWPGTRLYDKQLEIMLSVRDNNETFVHAANELGKTRCAALIVLHFFSTRFPAKIVTSSSAEKQLKQILWSEIDVLIRTAAHPLGIKQDTLRLQVMDETRGLPFGEHYVVGHVTNKVENFQGAHLARDPVWLPRVLMLFDESSGIQDEFYHAAQSQAHRLVSLGNPLTTEGFFYHECSKGSEPDPDRPGYFYRKVIHIDGLDSPNVKIGKAWEAAGKSGMPPELIPGLLNWPEYKRRERIWDPIKRQTRLHGHFYRGEEHLMFPPLWLDACEDAWEQVATMRRSPCYMGIDTAEGGGDMTVWTVIDWVGVVDVVVMSTKESEVINPITMKLMAKWHIPARNVVYDKGGGGAVHVRLMRARGYRVRGTYFAESPNEPREYKNRRAEIYGLLRKAMNPKLWTKTPPSESGNAGDTWRRCFAIPADESELFSPELREELSVLPMLYDSESRIFLPPKNRTGNAKATRIKTIREMIGRSPDRSDSLALAVYARDGGIGKKVAKLDSGRVMAADPEELDRAARAGRDRQPAQTAEPARSVTLEERLFGPARGRGNLSGEDSLWG